jgi:rubredoxin
MKGSNMIKICSILILISGIFSVIAGGVGFLAMSFVAAFGGPVILLVLGCILVILSGVLSIKAGSTGIKNCANPAMANTLIRWGILIMGMSLLGNIFQAAANESFDLSTVWKLLGGLLIPGLYTYGAWQLLSSTGQKFSFGGRAPLQQGQPQQPVPPQTPQMNYQQPMQGQPQQPAQSIQPAQPQTPVQQADGSWVCPRCGFTNKTGKFCTNCGAPKN